MHHIHFKWNDRHLFKNVKNTFHFFPLIRNTLVYCVLRNYISRYLHNVHYLFTTKDSPTTPIRVQYTLRYQTLCSNTAFYAPTYLPCQQLTWAYQLALTFFWVGRMCLCKTKPALASSSCRWLPHLSTLRCVIKSSKSSPSPWLRMSHRRWNSVWFSHHFV